MKTTEIKKGDRIQARWFQATKASLAGVQPKVGVAEVVVTGVVKHVRGDHPTSPTIIRFYVDPDGDCNEPRVQAYGCTCSGGHVEVNPAHVVNA